MSVDMEKARSLMALEPIIAFLETKNSREPFDYVSPSRCMFAQFYRSHGFHVSCTPNSVKVYDTSLTDVSPSRRDYLDAIPIPDYLNQIARCGNADFCTFGAALAYAKTLRSNTSES